MDLKGLQPKKAGSPTSEPVVIGHSETPGGEIERADLYNDIADLEEGDVEVKVEERELQIPLRPQVDWGIPFDEVNYSAWTIHMLAERIIQNYDGFITTESTYVVDARNYIHNRYLSGSELPYLMMVDSDVLLPRGAVETLIALSQERDDEAVVSGWYHKKKMGDPVPAVYNVYDKERQSFLPYVHEQIKDFYLKEKTTRVAAVAAGCMLMPRGVAEQLGEFPYEFKADGQPLGEDMALCRQLSALKIDIMVHWPLLCRHLGVGFI